MVTEAKSGQILGINTYRVWLINFNQSTRGKFLVFGTPEQAKAAAEKINKSVFKGKYCYPPKIKEITEKIR